MNLFIMGRPATQGIGPPRYTLRVPIWPAENVRLEEVEKVNLGETATTNVAGRITTIEKCEDFFVLRMPDFTSDDTARDMWRHLTLALVRLSARTGAALQFPSPLAEIARGGDPHLQFREKLQDSEYPPHWSKRADGTRTDGGIFATDACILPEHERIWEYPTFFGKVLQTCNLAQLNQLVVDSKEFRADVAENDSVRMASRTLWVACAQDDLRVIYILLITTLDILAEDEEVPNRTPELEQIVAEIREHIRPESDAVLERLLKRLSKKTEEIKTRGMRAKIRSLVLRAFGFDNRNSPEYKKLKKELDAILDKRGALAHGGGFLSPPTADENERLRNIVAVALEQRLKDLAAGSHGQGSSDRGSFPERTHG